MPSLAASFSLVRAISNHEHPRSRLLNDPNLRRLLRMVLSHRRLLVYGLIATAVSASTEPVIARLAAC